MPESIDFDQVSVERSCLVLAMCAMVQTQVLDRAADDLIRFTLRTRQTVDYVESPSLDSVHISFFLFATFFGRGVHNTAWFYLREAITFAQLIGLDNEESYRNISSRSEAAFRRRTFWVLYVTERAYAIQRHHSLSMQPSVDLPSILDRDTVEDLTGFHFMVDLWSKIDLDFLTLWNDSRHQVSPEYMVNLHHKIQHALPSHLEIPAVQRVDILVSQQWLRVIVWQLSTSRMLLSSTAADHSLHFTFPIAVCHDLLQVTSGTSLDILKVHGLGLIEKLFEVASTVVDVMVLQKQMQIQDRSPEAPRYLAAVLALMRQLRQSKNPWTSLLEKKISQSLPESRLIDATEALGDSVLPKVDPDNSQTGNTGVAHLQCDDALEWPSSRAFVKKEG
jgi:hypothetical protein